MIVTAREALRLYCHQPRNDKVAYCIADGCMAWRWLHAEGAPFVVTRDPELAQGFCGLAYAVRLPVPVPGNRTQTAADRRREVILSTAQKLAKEHGVLVAVQDVADDLASRKISLDLANPAAVSSSIAATLNHSQEWKRESHGLFKYLGL